MTNKVFRKMATNNIKEMSKVPIKMQDLKIDSLNFSDISKNNHGGQFTNLQLDTNPFKIQMPQLPTWGIKCFKDESKPTEPPKYHLNLVFKRDDVETNKKVKAALNKLEELQEKIINMLMERSKEFFNKKVVSRDYVDACFSKFIQKSKDKETQEEDGRYSSIKLKLNLSREGDKLSDKFMAKLFNKDKNKLVDENDEELTVQNYDKFTIGTEIKAVIQPGMVWFIGTNKCGLTWNLHQGIVPKLEQKSGNDVCIIQDSSDDDANDSSDDSSDDETNDD
jgi:hypothetical protein